MLSAFSSQMNRREGTRLAWVVRLLVALLGVSAARQAQAQIITTVPANGYPYSTPVSVIAGSDGINYVLEQNTGRVIRFNASGTPVIYAGGGTTVVDQTSSDLTLRQTEAFNANLFGAQSIRFGPNNFLYVADSNRNRILRITPDPFPGGGFVLTARVYAGMLAPGFAGDGGPSTSAQLNRPTDMAFDAAGNLYIADTNNFRVRKVDTTTGIITTVAGNGSLGSSGDGGAATDAAIGAPRGVAVDSTGNLYIATYDNSLDNTFIRKVTPQGIISTIAGIGTSGFSGDAGPATQAAFNQPTGLAVDGNNIVYVSDTQNHRIRIVTPTGKVQTIAGTGVATNNGTGELAIETSLNTPRGLFLAPNGDLLIADFGGNRALKLNNAANAPRVSIEGIAPSSITITPGGLSQTAQITVARFNFAGSVGVRLTNLPDSVFGGVTGPGTTNTGTISVGANTSAIPGTYNIGVQALAFDNGDPVSAVGTTMQLIIAPVPTLTISQSSLSFSGTAGAANPASQTVNVLDASFGYIAWAALATTTSGGNWLRLSPASGNQSNPMVVSVVTSGLAAGTYTGNVQVSSPGANGTPKNIPVTLTLIPPPPQISANGIKNNASYDRAATSVAPGSIVAIFGSNLTNGQSCVPPTCNPQFGSNGRLGTTMVGSSVTVAGISVPFYYATPGQIGVQIPAEIGPGTADVRVTVDGRLGNTASINVDSTAPGIFTTTSNGVGAGAITHADGSIVSAGNPARPEEVLVLYATGLGGTTPAVPTGALPTEASPANATVLLSVDGIEVTPDYAGLAGCCVGLNQVNFKVPAGVRTNTNVAVTINVGGRIGNPVTLAIGAPNTQQ